VRVVVNLDTGVLVVWKLLCSFCHILVWTHVLVCAGISVGDGPLTMWCPRLTMAAVFR
jgi:hypothetical protein